jgi:hypothetical protein
MEEEFTRAFKRARGEIRQQARDLRSSLLSGANQGTKRRREIKAFAEEAERRAIIDLTTEYRANPNKDDYESDISQRGIDQFIPPESTERDDVGGGVSGFNEQTLTICVDGQPEDRIFLTRET